MRAVNAPMVQINDDYFEDLTAESFKAVLEALKRGENAGDRVRKSVVRIRARGRPHNTDGGGCIMLRDEDRIFQNLYGQDDWGLEGARARGIWDNTKALLEMGREKLV